MSIFSQRLSWVKDWVIVSWVFGASHRAEMKVVARAAVISRFPWGKTHFQVHSHSCWLIRMVSGLTVCWLFTQFLASLL